jgi:hypothetical protein
VDRGEVALEEQSKVCRSVQRSDDRRRVVGLTVSLTPFGCRALPAGGLSFLLTQKRNGL